MIHVFVCEKKPFSNNLLIDCGDPSPTNGISDTPRGTMFGAYAFISCEPQYVLEDGEHLIHCLKDGHWSSIPICTRGIAF